MEVAMRVARWGNSLAVRLPKALVDKMQLKEGDEVAVRALKGALGVDARPDVEEHLRALRKLRGTIPADFKFDREEANER
jgi:antitoxin MazE